ncbi:MAG: hypothetical protein PWQ41_1156 [Bacillota bacterium]|jgi:hypothetical protein|nr:hypothetical protein [Bacillota bacterium]
MNSRISLIRTGAFALLLAVVLTGCRVPQGTPGAEGKDSTPQEPAAPSSTLEGQPQGENSAEAPKPVLGAAAPAFTGEELATGNEVAFPAASAGRVAVLSFFSPG